jgi:hypothetical protein
VSDFPDEDLEGDVDDGKDLPDAAPAPFNTRPMLVFDSAASEPAGRRASLRFSTTTPADRMPRLRSARSLDEVSVAGDKDFGTWVGDSDDSGSDGSGAGDWEEFRVDDGDDDDENNNQRNPLDGAF